MLTLVPVAVEFMPIVETGVTASSVYSAPILALIKPCGLIPSVKLPDVSPVSKSWPISGLICRNETGI